MHHKNIWKTNKRSGNNELRIKTSFSKQPNRRFYVSSTSVIILYLRFFFLTSVWILLSDWILLYTCINKRSLLYLYICIFKCVKNRFVFMIWFFILLENNFERLSFVCSVFRKGSCFTIITKENIRYLHLDCTCQSVILFIYFLN